MGERSKIRMQEPRVKISSRKNRDSGQKGRKRQVSRAGRMT
jgi:hypothetical protein